MKAAFSRHARKGVLPNDEVHDGRLAREYRPHPDREAGGGRVHAEDALRGRRPAKMSQLRADR